MMRTKTMPTHFCTIARGWSGLGRLWRRGRRALAVIFLIWVVTLAPLPWPVTPVMGATYTVDRTDDPSPPATACTAAPNDCSLRGAIIAANTAMGPDTIILQSGQTYTLSLDPTASPGDEDTAAEDDLDIVGGSTITIQVQGSGVATITRSGGCNLDGTDAAGEFRIFEVLSGGNLTLQNVRVTNGCADGNAFPDFNGGGIRNASGGTVTIQSSTISGNRAGGDGGGIHNFGTAVTIQSSTISGNRAGGDGGGIRNLDGAVTLTNSTLSGNSSGSSGGGISNEGAFNTGTVNASFVTIANNSAGTSGQGGGIFNAMGGTVNIKNSIVGNNTGTNCAGFAVTASGTNLDTDGSCDFTTVPSTGPGGLNLGPLANNGGPTQTHALLAGSAAVDFAADCTFLTPPGGNAVTDQRPVSRPQGSMCDVGAYEARGAVSMDGGGHCLFLDPDAGTYQLIRATPPGGIITGQLVSRLRGSVLSFQNRRGEPRLLKGTINFMSGRGSAAMIFPLSQGGGRVIITDSNILSNPTCLPVSP